MNIQISDTIKAIQVNQDQAPQAALDTLHNWAEFKDSDKSLNEFLVSTGTVQEILAKAKDKEAIEFYNALLNKLNETEACYVMITNI